MNLRSVIQTNMIKDKVIDVAPLTKAITSGFSEKALRTRTGSGLEIFSFIKPLELKSKLRTRT
jgi:hypothetical protein